MDIIGGAVAAHHLDLVQRIHALLDASAEGGAGFLLKEVEPTLTEGYARALELEAESLRLEHHMNGLTQAMADGRSIAPAELSALLTRLHETEQQTEDLRALLVRLRKLVAKAA